MANTLVLANANVGITQSIYTHLYGREEAEQAFREAMSGAEVGKSLATTDHGQPDSTEVEPQATKPIQG